MFCPQSGAAVFNAQPQSAFSKAAASRRNGRYLARPLNAPKVLRRTSARSSSVQSGGLDALGRRAAEGVPDSRSASERGGSAKREKPCEQGRRHLAVNS